MGMAMTKKKMLPVGIESFEDVIRNGYYYIDKTGLIAELLTNPSMVNLFTRPRRFGKSLNMSMLRCFFETSSDPHLFDGLKIAEETELFEEYMGRFPVIAVSLKGIEGTDYGKALAMFKGVIHAELLRHSYLMDSDILDQYDKNILEPMLFGEISEEVLPQSLWILSRMLHKHHGRKVVILIDEYDVPLARADVFGYYDRMVTLIRNLFHQALKTNESLQTAVLTGCMRIAKESIFTGMNNLKIHSVTGVKFDEYFGFTDGEVRNLLDSYGFGDKYEVTKEWYDGYRFGNVSVYCPWDVINYVYDLEDEPYLAPQNYWSNTSSNDIIRRFLDKATATTRREMEQLIGGQGIEKEIYPELTYAELDKTIDHLWSVLFTTGYLTYERSPSNGFADRNRLKLKIPNEEIRSIFKEQILTWFRDQVKTDEERYRTFCQAFLDGDSQKVQEMLNAYLRETISIRDTSVRKSMKENFYHGILFGILNFRTDWYVSSNREAGEGYNDIMIVHDGSRTGMILEIKYSATDDLDAECQKALGQIDALHYTDVFEEYDVGKVYKYAIACYKKRCKVILAEEFR